MNARTILRTGLRIVLPLAVAVSLSGCVFDASVQLGKPGGTSKPAVVKPHQADKYTDPGEGNRIDLEKGCRQQQGPGSKPVIIDGQSVDGIVCVGGKHQGESLDIQSWCNKALPGSVADDSNPSVPPYGWQCVSKYKSAPVDLAKLCPSGWSLAEFPSNKPSYRFRCVNPNRTNTFDWVRYCVNNFPSETVYSRATRKNDPMSHGCSPDPI